MPADPYGARDLVAVKPISTANFLYGFHTNTTASDRTDLGQIDAQPGGAYIDGLVLGANSPKPARAKKYRTGGGYKSSFCDVTKINDARAAGWKIIDRPSFRLGANGPNSKCVYIRIATLDAGGAATSEIKYAWMMPNYLYTKITSSDLAALGIRDGVGEKDLVFGARHPDPPQAVYVAIGADGSIGTRTTFVDPDNLSSLPTGWSPAQTKQNE